MPQTAILFATARSAAGRPIVPNVNNQGMPLAARLPGNSWFVNSETGDDSNLGSLQSPFATIMAAHAAASAGDTILVFTGTYDENVIITKNYISLIGLATAGYGRPDVTPAAGIALKVTTGQGFYAENMRFASADSDSVVQNANGFSYNNCVFDGSAGQAANETNFRLVPSATDNSYSASEGVVQNCLIRGSTSGIGMAFQHALAAGGGEGVSDLQILNNRFYGNAVDLKTLVNTNGGGAGILLNSLIAGNSFMTAGAAFVYGDMDQGAAGDLAANSFIIQGNSFADDALIAAQFAMGGQPKCFFVGNYAAPGLVNGATFND